MRLVHRPADAREDRRVLAETVETAESALARARGLMFRRRLPEGHALVFRFGRVRRRGLHMLFVPFAVDAVWLVEGRVTACKRLRPWIGIGRGRADTVIELPAGTAEDVCEGDVLRLD